MVLHAGTHNAGRDFKEDVLELHKIKTRSSIVAHPLAVISDAHVTESSPFNVVAERRNDPSQNTT